MNDTETPTISVHDDVPPDEGRLVAAALVRAFEGRAIERGCRISYLETFSFQAPSLYRAPGYEVRLALEGFAPGITKYTMVRTLPVRVAYADPARFAAGTDEDCP